MTKRRTSILERPVYGVSEAAGILGLRAQRARSWLDGYTRHGVVYPPVIRPDATGDDTVTWGEFVELGYLRSYRNKGVPLQRLRPVIDELRREFDTAYPLATAKPFVLGKELVLEAQERNGLPQANDVAVAEREVNGEPCRQGGEREEHCACCVQCPASGHGIMVPRLVDEPAHEPVVVFTSVVVLQPTTG